MRSSTFSLTARRFAFARISRAVNPAASSMYKGASDNLLLTCVSACQSSCDRYPDRSLSASIIASDDITRSASCSRDISRLKMPTGFLRRTALYAAMFNASDVFPDAWPRRQDDQLLGLEPADLKVQVLDTSGDPPN